MAIALPPLPYAENALEPYMSATTVRFHHDGHQARYVETTNDLVARDPHLRNAALPVVVQVAASHMTIPRGPRPQKFWTKLFEQSSQAWNHALFWHSMRPRGGGRLPPRLARFIDLEDTKGAFRFAAASHFGSGWVWLYEQNKQLHVIATTNAQRPPGRPLLVCDLWEHAYYLDYPDAKAEFVRIWLDHLVNWDFAERTLYGAIPLELQ